jgi:hypothetical protein
VQTVDATAGASADNAALSTRRLTSDSGTFVNGQYDFSGATGNITLTASSVTELEFGLQLTSDAAYGDTYDFRVYRGASTALNTYTNTPRVTVNQYTLAMGIGSYTDFIANVISNETRAAAGYGTLTLTGIAAALSSSSFRGITAARGNLALTGQAATLSYQAARNLTATTGSYGLTGNSVGLQRKYTLACSQGSYAEVIANGITKETKAAAAAGTLVLTGIAATLTKSTHSTTLVCAQGSYAWTIASGISQETRATATRGQVSWSGSVANLTVARTLSCAPGSYVWSGPPSTRDLALNCASGAVALSGQPILFGRNARILVCGTGILAWSGPQSTRDLSLGIATNQTSLTGQFVTLLKSKVLISNVGSLALTGQNAQLRATRNLVLVQGSAQLTGQPAALTVQRRLACATGLLVGTGAATGLAVGRKLACAQGSATLTGQGLNFLKNSAFALSAAGGTLSLTGQPAALTRQLKRTLTITSAAQLQLRTNPSKVIAITSPAVVTESNNVAKSLSISAFSSVSVARSLTKSLAITSTSTISLAKAIAKKLSLTSTSAVGSSAVTSGGGHQVTLNVLSTATVKLKITVNKSLSIVSTGMPQLIKSVFKNVLFTSISSVIAGLVANINTSTGALKRARKLPGSSGYMVRGDVDMIVHDPIDVVCGDDWKFAGPQYDELGNPLNLVGASFNWKLDDLSGTTNYINVTSDTGAISVVDQTNSIVLVNVSRSFTTSLTPGDYRDWMVATLGDGSIVTLSSGIVRVAARPA